MRREHLTDTAIIAVLTAVVLGIGACRIAPGVTGVYHDDGVYLATARSLSEGNGYRLIDLPGSPPQTKYPPVYPLLLSMVWALWPAFPDNLVALKLVTLCCQAFAISAAYLFMVRFQYASRSASFAASLVAGTALSTGYFATQTLSEPLFAALVAIALWRAENLSRMPLDPARDFRAGLVLALPFLTRTLGAAGLLVAVWHLYRSGRLTPWIAAGAGLVVGGWAAWVFAAPRLMQGAVPDYYSAANYFGWWGEASWEVLLLNALWLAMMTAHLPAEGVGRSLPWPALFVGGVLIWLAVVRGRQHGRLLSQTLVGYGILILFWPWPPARFLIPLLPFLVLYAVEMVVEFSKLLPRRADEGSVCSCRCLHSCVALERTRARHCDRSCCCSSCRAGAVELLGLDYCSASAIQHHPFRLPIGWTGEEWPQLDQRWPLTRSGAHSGLRGREPLSCDGGRCPAPHGAADVGRSPMDPPCRARCGGGVGNPKQRGESVPASLDGRSPAGDGRPFICHGRGASGRG
jgi:hypothetical protein